MRQLRQGKASDLTELTQHFPGRAGVSGSNARVHLPCSMVMNFCLVP